MEPYFKEKIFRKTIVVLPSQLTTNLLENVRTLLTQKYLKTYLDEGYIFNIKILQIIDNRISLSGQIMVTVEFKADFYIPEVGHIFYGKIKSSLAKKIFWVEIGPLIIFLDSSEEMVNLTKDFVTVQIIDIKSDKTLCFGKIL